jgi:mono/diheme cytochrome c family protein
MSSAEEDDMARAACAVGLGLGILCSATAAADQIADGKKLFADNCASCHGERGEGKKKAPPLVGPNALPLDPPPGAKVRKVQFRTAKEVLDFTSQKMPMKKPGSLKPEEYAAIVAFDLKANGVNLAGKTIDATTAEQIVLHPPR